MLRSRPSGNNASNAYYHALSSFAPEIIKHILSQNEVIPPFVKTFQSVGFFADISGFTKASEKLAELGDLGTELLAHKINSYLPHIARKIVGCGGDVVKFAGDALLCIWPPPPSSLKNEHEHLFHKYEQISRTSPNDATNEAQFKAITKKYLQVKKLNYEMQLRAQKQAVHVAVQCAIQIQNEFKSMDLTPAANRRSGVEPIEFRVKLGIGVGRVHVLIVGGTLGRLEYLICGNALIQAFDSENDCSVKDDRMIVVSSEVQKLCSDAFLFKAIAGSTLGNLEIVKRLKKVRGDQYPRLVPDNSNQLAVKLASYVPAAVRPHLQMPIQTWAGELREVTIMFISLPWHARSLAKVSVKILNELQTIISRLQSIIYKYQGSLNKFLVDDKGSTVMAVFGLPPVAHKNDSARAILAALELNDHLKCENNVSVGLSCGVVFVGIIGNKGSRREYGILGDKVNLSARLMSLSKKNSKTYGSVICDEVVYQRAENEPRIQWQKMKKCHVKGKVNAVQIYKPMLVNYEVSVHKIGHAGHLETSDRTSIKHAQHILNGLFTTVVCVNCKNTCKMKSVRSKKRIKTKRILNKMHSKSLPRANGDTYGLQMSSNMSTDNIRNRTRSPMTTNFFQNRSKKKITFASNSTPKSDMIRSESCNDDAVVKKEQFCRCGRVIFVEGEIAIGKTSLLAQINVRNQQKFWFIWGKADTFHELNPALYVVWQQVMLSFSQRFSLITKKNRYKFQTWIKVRRPDLLEWLYLIRDIIDIGTDDMLDGEQNWIGNKNHPHIITNDEYKIGGSNRRNADEEQMDIKRNDIVLTLLEWSARMKPIALVIDEIQHLTRKDWQLTRRACCLIKNGVLKNVVLFLSSTPMDNNRYTPYFKPKKHIREYTQLKDAYINTMIVPAPWSLSKTKFFITKEFDIGGCGSRLAETVHLQCGGRPGFCQRFLKEISGPQNIGKYIEVFYTSNNKKTKYTSVNNPKELLGRKDMYCNFTEDINNKFNTFVEVEFPVPSLINGITFAHLDKLSTAQSFALKIASVICKAVGNNAIEFEEHMIRGLHPYPDTGMAKVSIMRETLNTLCKMNFIYKREPEMIPSIANGYNSGSYTGSMCSNQSVAIKAYTFGECPTPEIVDVLDLDHNIISSSAEQKYNSMPTSTNSSPRLLHSIYSIDIVTIPPVTDVNLSNGSATVLDPMPKTESLLQMPAQSVPYKKGKMYKKGLWKMTECQRYFIFKHRTLYWLKDTVEVYPRGRIKFDKNVGEIEINTNTLSFKIKAIKKPYILRCKKLKDFQEWNKLFLTALEYNVTTNSQQNKPNDPQYRHSMYPSTSGTKNKKRLKYSGRKFSSKKRNTTSSFTTSIKTNSSSSLQSSADIADIVDVESSRSCSSNSDIIDGESSCTQNTNNNKNVNDEIMDELLVNGDDGKQRKKVAFRVLFEDEESAGNSSVIIHDDDDESYSDSKSFHGEDSSSSDEFLDDDELFDLHQRGGAVKGDSSYYFAYGFLRDVVYHQMLHAQRKQLHTNAQKYIARCLTYEHGNDELALLHTRHVEIVQKYSSLLQGFVVSNMNVKAKKRKSFFNRN